jgi:predicted secreted protein
MAGLTELVGKLQEKLQVKQMNFSPTDATRKQHENELIEEAMVAFKERVAIVGKHMDQKSHRIVNIHISSGGYQPPIMYERTAMKTMSMDVSSSPAVEAGMNKITVTVNGSVQFF